MEKLRVRRLGYALGAEISGLDLRERLSDETVAAVRKQWLEHIVLCFPGQDLTPQQLLEFGERFGDLYTEDNPERHPEFPKISMFVNKPTTINGKSYPGGIAQEWHTDQAFTVRPTSGSLLNAQVLPDVGGGTMFANQYMAYETLSPTLQRIVDGLEVVNDLTVSPFFGRRSPERQAEMRDRYPPTVHPLARVHPETGRKALFADSRLRLFRGMTEEESAPLKTYLRTHAIRYEFTYRHRWSVGDLVMWDNRCALHYAVPDYDRSQLRRMQRCELVGDETGRLLAETEREVALH